jgi:hypothetical protein
VPELSGQLPVVVSGRGCRAVGSQCSACRASSRSCLPLRLALAKHVENSTPKVSVRPFNPDFRFESRLAKTGGRPVKHTRYYWLLLAESHLTRRLFGAMVGRIAALPVPSG